MTRIVLIRHGQTAWNREGRFRGRADIPLDEVGRAQAEATAARVAKSWPVIAVYSSPLMRAVETAKAVARPFGLVVQPVEALIDIDYGAWQGLTQQQVEERWPEELRLWFEAPHEVRIPGGESLADLRRRAMEAIRNLGANHPRQTITVVGHTVLNRVILLAALGLGNERFWHLSQDTCAINVLETRGDDLVIVTINDICHLQGLEP